MAKFIVGVPESVEGFPLMATVQVQMQQITVSTPNSRLLDLPGELRNKIYSFCIEPGPVPLRLRHEDKVKPVGKYRCFAQTCRQIRHEFHLTYMEQTTFRLESTYHYARYIRDFYPLTDEDTMMRYRGSIISLVHHSRDKTEGVNEFYDADIARVVQLVARSPNVRFTFELHERMRRSSAQSAVAQVNSMLALFADPSDTKWRNMAKAIKEIRLRVQNHDSILRILMDEEMARKWKSTVFRIWDDATEPARGIRLGFLVYHSASHIGFERRMLRVTERLYRVVFIACDVSLALFTCLRLCPNSDRSTRSKVFSFFVLFSFQEVLSWSKRPCILAMPFYRSVNVQATSFGKAHAFGKFVDETFIANHQLGHHRLTEQ
ncbi:uncharacterized protein ALTATR162_LOCUS3876 [Alternaria atra]|uniref:F-box domain-containing protein n=1 Tax=Alternaria atra TaxID=119953 RepID=A0A8J2I1L5_9PLEO|nr:uncharacterized protein ALTATR162_LOCUS3876 [Alternaria atra]CAG5155870.1 unnamed protein product [Alternaria atra]